MQINSNSTQGKKPPPQQAKGQPALVTGAAESTVPPFASGNKQLATTPTGKTNAIAQLTEATANMHISSKPFANNNHQTISHTPKSQQGPMGSLPASAAPPPASSASTTPVVPKNFIQLPNGFNYNPYQIMGFQNKQTNEFALNVLKSQQFDPAHMANQQSTGAPGPGVSGPIPGVAIGPATTVVPQVLAATPTGSIPSVHPNLQSTATTGLPNWKIGDRCLAKYWEDGGVSGIISSAIH